MRHALVSACFVVAFLPIYGQKASKKQSNSVELDFTRLALQSRARVVQVLGPPERVNKPTGAIWSDNFYAWGFAHYEEGRLKAFEYEYKQVPSSVGDALERVGLKQTSDPHETPFMIYWSTKAGPLICCGLEMESVVLMTDFSEIIVRFNRRIDAQKPH